jgi:hypothetical protein
MLLELIHATRVLRAWRDDPNRHVCDVSLFVHQKDEHRPYTAREIDSFKALVRKHAWSQYVAIFYREDRRHHTFEIAEPRRLSYPRCKQASALLQTPKSVERN